jgi:hypothetical protein
VADLLPPDRRADGENDRAPGAPRWVKASAVVAILLVLLFAALRLAGGGFHGHMPR